MAHEVETAMFVGQSAWHGLGTVLNAPPTTKEAIVAAGLDWQATLTDQYYTFNGELCKSSHRAVVRSTDGKQIGSVGQKFEPLQNADAFAWFDPVIEAGLVDLEAAGALREGRRVWILGKVRGAITEVTPGDEINQYMLLAHAHDGTLQIQAGFTDVRVVCNNTLQSALKDASRLLKFKHTKNAKIELEKARNTFDVAKAQLIKQTEAFKYLAASKCDDTQAKRYFREVFTEGGSDDEQASKTLVNKIFPLFESGRGAHFSRGTLWGAYNAVTEFNTHERGRSADARLDNVWFGKSAKENGRALTVALQFAKAA